MNAAQATRSADLYAAAYEMKYQLPEDRAAEVEAWGRRNFAPDKHSEGGVYRITSLYFDTHEFDIYFRTPDYYRWRKFRIRRYSLGEVAYLERKTRKGNRVAKKRWKIPLVELSKLTDQEASKDWEGHSFHRRLKERRLVPSLLVQYLRTAFEAEGSEGPMRLTLDRQVEGAPANAISLNPLPGARRVLPGRVIVELKFRAALPGAFRRLIGDLRLDPGPVSKYRLCWEAWGGPSVHA